MKLPIFAIEIDEEEGAFVDAVALVETPAIGAHFMAFADQPQRLQFATNDERMELIGPALIPDMLIYRRDEETGKEFDVYFSKDVIRKAAQIFMRRGLQASTNIGHTVTPAKSFIFQSYIVDSEKGIAAPDGINAPDGSWIVGVKVEDKSVWEEIKAGRVRGFSVEGLFFHAEVGNKPEKSINSLEDTVIDNLEKIISLCQSSKK